MPNAHPRPWHKEAVFGDGPRVPLDRERRAVWKARVNLFRRARKLTPLFEDIALALIKRLGTTGRLDPSHQTLADAVECCEKSVRDALKALKACGLISWVQRLVRAGWRVAQTSNAYVLTLGEPPKIPASPCGGKFYRETSSLDKSREYTSVAPPSADEIASAKAALARRRAVIEERVLRRRCAAPAAT